MTIQSEDLRAAVQRGLITEAQAASLTAMAEARRTALQAAEPAEEPFVLFKGFNEVFIVVGLAILFGGWMGVTALMGWDLDGDGGQAAVALSAITLLGLGLLSNYFTLKRRMIAPSIALSIMVALTAGRMGWSLAEIAGLSDLRASALGWGIVLGVMLLYYRRYRVPFSAAIIACAAFSLIWSVLAAGNVIPGDGYALWRFSADGPLAVVSVLFGLALFVLAMRFDMTDPHRVTTRSATGFWLHVSSAPLIVNTIAMNLMESGVIGAQLMLFLFLLVLAVIAVVIDRRSFLVSGAAYAVALAFTLFDGSALVIVFLGLGLVLLGANWERMRGALMRALPDFPGKTRLPPYASHP